MWKSLLFLLLTGAAHAEEIPLKSIWAWNMPGTRDLKEFDDSEAQQKIIQPLLNHIRESWNNDHGVAVQGEGLEALQHFIRIEMDGEKPDLLSPDVPISLVFYTKHAGLFVHLHSVEQKGNRFVIRYQLVPHRERVSTQHLALIPVGKLSPGKYVVNIEQLPMEKQYQDIGYPKRMSEQVKNVCNSFQFIVLNKRQGNEMSVAFSRLHDLGVADRRTWRRHEREFIGDRRHRIAKL